jgi:hypothetical protein
VSAPADLRSATWAIDMLDRAAAALLASPHRAGSIVRLPAHGRLVVTGDLHDNPAHLGVIVRLARLEHSPDHHVIFQEMIHGEQLVNGADLSHRMLLRVAELVTRFPTQVHPLLANHELAQMTGKGVSKGAGNSVRLFNDGLEFVFNDHWEEVARAINRFIRAMPLALATESGVFCAHSLPAPGTQGMDRFDLNIIKRDLRDEDYLSPGEGGIGSAYLMTWGRGHSAEQIESLAKAWHVNLFMLGHEHVEAGCEMKGPKLVKINSDHEQGAAVIVDLAHPPTAEQAMNEAVRLRGLV